MKKSVLVFSIILVLTLVFVLSAAATAPATVEGYVPLSSVGSDGIDFWYDVCDPYLVGHFVQPAEPPGLAALGTFTSGNPDYGDDPPNDACPYTTELSGTCEGVLIPVEIFGDPDSKPGRAFLGRCTGDLEGYHAVYVIDEWYGYVAKYHIDP
jgi:hypothetical protein